MRCAIRRSSRQKTQRHAVYDSIGLNRSCAELWELNAERLSSATRAARQESPFLVRAVEGESPLSIVVLASFALGLLVLTLLLIREARIRRVVLSPGVQIPTELEKHFVVLEHELTGREQLEDRPRDRNRRRRAAPRRKKLNSCSSTAGLTQ